MTSRIAGGHDAWRGALRSGAVAVWVGFGSGLAAQDPSDLVDVKALIPDAVLDLRYATPDNCAKKPLYPVNRCFLRRRVAERLKRAADELFATRGYRIKIWDGYRPLSVQKELWKAMPDSRYVGDPARGSRHNRGAAIDLTLVGKDGRELRMPTPFDSFSPRAAAYAELTGPEAAERMANRKILQDTMRRHGFKVMKTEWWHFDAVDWTDYELLDLPLEEVEREFPPAAAPPEPEPAPQPDRS